MLTPPHSSTRCQNHGRTDRSNYSSSRRTLTLGATSASALLLMSAPVAADCPRPYRLIRLCEVPSPTNIGAPEGAYGLLYGSDNTFGINDAGQVVGTKRILLSTQTSCGNPNVHTIDDLYERCRAFLWLPHPQVTSSGTLPASANSATGCGDDVYDLHAMAGWSDDEFSFANDISEPSPNGDGGQYWHAVGFKLCAETDPRATLWRLDGATASSVPTSDITPNGTLSAFAYAVSEPIQYNPLTQALEVAVALKASVGCYYNFQAYGQIRTLIGTQTDFYLSPNGLPARGGAMDVEAPMFGFDPWHHFVGYDAPSPANPCSGIGFSDTNCDYDGRDALQWNGVGAAPVPLGNPWVAESRDAEARGNALDDLSCGWSTAPDVDPGPEAFCPKHAVVWSGGAIDDITGDPTSFRRSRAEAISLPIGGTGSARTVVGQDITNSLGLVWHGNPGDWCEYYADDITLYDVDCVTASSACGLPSEPGPNAIVVEINQLHDVNSSGHAVGIIKERTYNSFGQLTDTRYFAAVLGPASDLDEDLDVDSADLAILLGEWGESVSPANLNCGTEQDTAEGGVVGASDLAILLGAWSGNGVPSPVLLCDCVTGQGESASAPGGSATWDAIEAIQAVGFESPQALAQWLQGATEMQGESVAAWLIQSMGGGQEPEQ
jgi:hypothetical protein